MNDLAYRPLLWLLEGLSLLPLKVLYLLSDLIYIIIYYIVRYRRNVVEKNIRESFPEMTDAEVRATSKKFFRNFTDYFVETIKLHHISDKEMMRRMEFVDTEVIDRLMDEGRSIVVYFSHCGNWEWAPSITLHTRHKANIDAVFAQVYRPLRNKFFDEYFLHLRSRFGSKSFPKSTVLRDLLRVMKSGLPSITGFMSDQKPSHGDVTHVVEFLNHPTAIITGTEQLARRLKMAVIYWDMEKITRGHYRITTRLMAEDTSATVPYELTDGYARLLEATIRRNPSIWLWSHKRWKIPVTFADDNSHEKRNSCNNS
ncbi:MAG: lysophospholipid acyltransferase family protein [Lachnoclostridium sp.]|nr:lysophospholipid acyltransferase family protein [Lachnoclostridium sp.]